MSKTPFSKKCEILGTLWFAYREDMRNDETWSEFLDWADVGLPLSYMASLDLVTVKKDAKKYVDETWEVFCDTISIDSTANYDGLVDCFQASPNPELKNNEG